MVLTALAAAVLAQAPTTEMRLLRSPDVHGDKVVFTYASDLWVAPKAGGEATRLTSHSGVEQLPKISPDGTLVAFSGQYEGGVDVYVVPITGGEPKRLTYETAGEYVTDWTPDGKIAFTSIVGSHTNRQERLWLVDPKGGMPERTPVAEAANASFSKDGSKIAYNRMDSYSFNWRRYRGGTQGRVSIFDLKTWDYSEVPVGREQNYHPMWVGDSIFFTSDKDFHNHNLFRYDTKNKRVERLTEFKDGDIRYPGTDGKTIVFERNNKLFAYDIASKSTTPVAVTIRNERIATRPSYRPLGNAVNDFDISPSGKRLVVDARGDVFTVPAKNGPTRMLTEGDGARSKTPRWSPDGQSIAYLSDRSGEWRIWTEPQMGGEPKMLNTDPGHIIENISYSPKGTYLAYTTAEAGLYLLDVKTGETKHVDTDPNGQFFGFDIAADESWVAYVRSVSNLNTALFFYNVKDGKSIQATDGFYSIGSVSFDLNGKNLYFTSNRTFNPGGNAFELGLGMDSPTRVYVTTLQSDSPSVLSPESDEEPVVEPKPEPAPAPEGEAAARETPAPAAEAPKPEGIKIDVKGIEDRAQPLPWGPGGYGFVIGIDNGVLTWSNGDLLTFSLRSRQPATIISGVSAISVNPKRDKFAYRAGNIIGIADLRPGANPQAGAAPVAGIGKIVDPRAEWNQMFWEVWRYQRDYFYDENMLGLDWKAIGDKYAELLPYVSHRDDLNYVMGQLIGELGTGHAYLGGGDANTSPSPQTVSAMLGADFEASGDHVRIAKVLRGVNYDPARRGPLAAPGVDVNDGDYLLSIDGQPVTSRTGIAPLLIAKNGRDVKIKVNSTPSMEGAREYTVQPIGSEVDLRYAEWVQDNIDAVNAATDGRVGYIHVPDTSISGIIEFVRGYYAQGDKEAWIIDERYNGGGSIPTFFVEFLARERTSATQQRHGADIPFPGVTTDGPKAMLINGYAGSGGDLFPYLFKKMGLGPLIGTRTWGGLVGIQGGADLVDGGFVTAPAFALYDPDTNEWIAENKGVDPDIEVDLRPDLVAKGEDPQLKAAIDHLMRQIGPRRKAPLKSPAVINAPK